MFTKKYEDVIELLKIKDDIDKTYLKKLGFEENSKCYFKHISNACWCIRKKIILLNVPPVVIGQKH